MDIQTFTLVFGIVFSSTFLYETSCLPVNSTQVVITQHAVNNTSGNATNIKENNLSSSGPKNPAKYKNKTADSIMDENLISSQNLTTKISGSEAKLNITVEQTENETNVTTLLTNGTLPAESSNMTTYINNSDAGVIPKVRNDVTTESNDGKNATSIQSVNANGTVSVTVHDKVDLNHTGNIDQANQVSLQSTQHHTKEADGETEDTVNVSDEHIPSTEGKKQASDDENSKTKVDKDEDVETTNTKSNSDTADKELTTEDELTDEYQEDDKKKTLMTWNEDDEDSIGDLDGVDEVFDSLLEDNDEKSDLFFETPSKLGKKIDSEELEKLLQGQGESHFFAFILTAIFFSAVIYLLYHNKRKVIGLVIPGAGNRRTGSRRPFKSNYEKLETMSEAKTYTF